MSWCAQKVLRQLVAVYNTFNAQPHLLSRTGLRTLRAQAHEAWMVETTGA